MNKKWIKDKTHYEKIKQEITMHQRLKVWKRSQNRDCLNFSKYRRLLKNSNGKWKWEKTLHKPL